MKNVILEMFAENNGQCLSAKMWEDGAAPVAITFRMQLNSKM